jgi:hypothetical protein
LVIELAEAVPAAVVERLRGFLVGSSAWFEEKRPGGYDLNVLADRLGAADPGEVDERRPFLGRVAKVVPPEKRLTLAGVRRSDDVS